MQRSKLINKVNKTKLLIDIRNFRKQQNYVVNLNKNVKFEHVSGYDLKTVKIFG